METVTLVRNELGPLLDRLIMQLEREGNLTYRAHFTRIRRRLNCANHDWELATPCLLYTSPSPRDRYGSRMPSSA